MKLNYRKVRTLIKLLIINFLFINLSSNAQVIKSILKLPDTGQNTSYTTTFGEDNDYNINTPYYVNLGNGTILDTITGLMWQQGDSGELTFENAKIYIDTLKLGGYSDWRLPNTYESFSILNQQNSNPAVNTTFFTKTGAEYWWTSNLQFNDTSKVWVTNAGGGIGNHRKSEALSAGGTKKIHARAVRNTKNVQLISSRFHDNLDGTITDSLFGLIWQKSPNQSMLGWEDALIYAEQLSLANETDWRLPNIKELQSLADVSIGNPCINTNFFEINSSNKYWSSTTLPNQPTKSWYLDTQFGITTYDLKTAKLSVLCVRGPISNLTKSDELISQNILIFPNPSNGELNIKSEKQIDLIQIYDILGNQIFIARNFNQQQPIFINQNGSYIIQLNIEQKLYSKKIQIF